MSNSNPLIGPTAEDTMSKVHSVLEFLGDVQMEKDCVFEESSQNGLALIHDTMKYALHFELERAEKEREEVKS